MMFKSIAYTKAFLKHIRASGRTSHRFSNQKLIVDYTVEAQIQEYGENLANFTRIDMVTELNGKVIELGKINNVNVEYNKIIYNLVKAIENTF